MSEKCKINDTLAYLSFRCCKFDPLSFGFLAAAAFFCAFARSISRWLPPAHVRVQTRPKRSLSESSWNHWEGVREGHTYGSWCCRTMLNLASTLRLEAKVSLELCHGLWLILPTRRHRASLNLVASKFASSSSSSSSSSASGTALLLQEDHLAL